MIVRNDSVAPAYRHPRQATEAPGRRRARSPILQPPSGRDRRTAVGGDVIFMRPLVLLAESRMEYTGAPENVLTAEAVC